MLNGFNIDDIFKNLQKACNNMKKANIIVVGKTGVGKSTLINSIFREDIAETGIGKPITQHLQKIIKEGVPVTLYDTKGLELNSKVQDEIKKEILNEIEKCNQLCIDNDDKNELIHVCWYCLDSSSGRCEDTDIEWISDISKKIPVIIVITKAFPKNVAKSFKKQIENLNLNCKAIVPVLAQPYEDIDEDDEDSEVIIINSYGLEKLVDITNEVLPEGVREAFTNAQKVSIDKKVSQARKWLIGYVAETAVVGMSPIPFSDAPILAASQLSMLIHLTTIFGVHLDKTFLVSIVSAAGGITGTTFAGKTLVSNLAKLIPGIGTIAGGAISASVAGIMTTTLGYAYISVMKFMLEQEAKGCSVSNDEIAQKMKEELKKEMTKK